MPKAWARRPICVPMPPRPTTSIVLPCSSSARLSSLRQSVGRCRLRRMPARQATGAGRTPGRRRSARRSAACWSTRSCSRPTPATAPSRRRHGRPESSAASCRRLDDVRRAEAEHGVGVADHLGGLVGTLDRDELDVGRDRASARRGRPASGCGTTIRCGCRPAGRLLRRRRPFVDAEVLGQVPRRDAAGQLVVDILDVVRRRRRRRSIPCTTACRCPWRCRRASCSASMPFCTCWRSSTK